MDFLEVVRRARAVHLEGAEPDVVEEHEAAQDAPEAQVYGRICSSRGRQPPATLASTPARKAVFVFGPDAVRSVILRRSAYDSLCMLGFDRPYLYHKLMVEKVTLWLVLFKPDAYCHGNDEGLVVVPATWDGVDRIVRTLYPEAHPSLTAHWEVLRTKPFEYFEGEAGFEFMEARRNIDSLLPNGPPFYSYEYFCSLPKPRTAWQVRAFLFCELRLLRLFRGDGWTQSEEGGGGGGGRELREYLCSNVPLEHLNPQLSAVIPMTVVMPTH